MSSGADSWLQDIPEHLLRGTVRDSVGVRVALDAVLRRSAVLRAVLYGPGCDSRTDVLLPCMCVGPGSRVGDLQPGSDGDGASVHLSDRLNRRGAGRRWRTSGATAHMDVFGYVV